MSNGGAYSSETPDSLRCQPWMSWGQCYKTFTDAPTNKLESLFTEIFQPSLIFVSNGGAYFSETPDSLHCQPWMSWGQCYKSFADAPTNKLESLFADICE